MNSTTTRMQDSYLGAFDTAPAYSQRLDYTPSPPQSMSPDPPSSNNSKAYAFVALPGNAQKKRPRRRYDEIERLYRCVYPECTKAYGTLNHLNAHIHTQKHGKKRLPVEFKQLRKQWRKEKKDQESSSSYCTTPQIPPPGSLDLPNHHHHYGLNPPSSSFDAPRPYMSSPWSDTKRYPNTRYYEGGEEWRSQGWNQHHPSSPESKPYPTSYPAHDYLSIDTQHQHHHQESGGSPLTPVTPLDSSNSPPSAYFGHGGQQGGAEYTPSPPSYHTDVVRDSDSYRGDTAQYGYTPARSIPYPIQTSSQPTRPLMSSSYPPPSSSSYGSDAVSPGGMSSYSAPSPPNYGGGMQRGGSLFTSWPGHHAQGDL